MLGIADCQQELKNIAAAKKVLKQLIAKYPGSEAASEAKKRLATLQVGHRIFMHASFCQRTIILKLRISEIFYSLQGETSRVGLPTVFVRLTGCPLRCTYCDTSYAFSGGQDMSIAQILEQVAHHHARYVTVTGGEPLAQKNCLPLLRALCDAGYEVSLETGGALDVSEVDARVMKVLDIKTPASGEMEKNLWSNLAASECA